MDRQYRIYREILAIEDHRMSFKEVCSLSLFGFKILKDEWEERNYMYLIPSILMLHFILVPLLFRLSGILMLPFILIDNWVSKM